MSKRFIDYSVAVTTPYTQEGDFDAASVPALIKYYVEELKFPGLLISGSTGEQHCMTIAERKQLYKIVKDSVPKGYPIYAGVAAFKTKDAIELAQYAESVGVSGIMLGMPPYRLPSQQELENYITDVARSISLPIFIYNNPLSNGCLITPETYKRIAENNKNVLGMKEMGHKEFVPEIKKLVDTSAMSFFTGSDETFIDLVSTFGYTSITSVAANVFPTEIQQMVEYVLDDQLDKAKEVMDRLLPKIDVLNQGGLLQSIHYVLRKRGLPAGYCPPPLLEPEQDIKQLLDRFV